MKYETGEPQAVKVKWCPRCLSFEVRGFEVRSVRFSEASHAAVSSSSAFLSLIINSNHTYQSKYPRFGQHRSLE